MERARLEDGGRKSEEKAVEAPSPRALPPRGEVENKMSALKDGFDQKRGRTPAPSRLKSCFCTSGRGSVPFWAKLLKY